MFFLIRSWFLLEVLQTIKDLFSVCLRNTQKAPKLIHWQTLSFSLSGVYLLLTTAWSSSSVSPALPEFIHPKPQLPTSADSPLVISSPCVESVSVCLRAGEHLAQLVFRSENSASLWSLKAIHAMCEMEQSRVRSDLLSLHFCSPSICFTPQSSQSPSVFSFSSRPSRRILRYATPCKTFPIWTGILFL